MKRYKLLKNLPTFNKGDIFRLTENGSLERESDRTIAYMASTLEKFNILDSEWFEEVSEYERWRAREGGLYWCVRDDGEVGNDCEIRVDVDDGRYGFGNYFKTEEEAQKAADWLRAFATLRDDTKGFKPEWSNTGQARWFVFYDRNSRRLRSDLNFTFQDGNLYFASEDDANDSIKNHKREWLTFFGVEE